MKERLLGKGYSGASLLCNNSARVASESCTSALSLDWTKALQFFGLDRYLTTKTDALQASGDDICTVLVQRTVKRGSTRRGTADRNTSRQGILMHLPLATLADRLDNSGFHRKLYPIKRNEPDDILKCSQKAISKQSHEDTLLTQTQTIPIQPPETPSIWVKPQSP